MSYSRVTRYQPTALSLTAARVIRKSMESTSCSPLLRDPSFIQMIRHLLRCHGNEDLQLEACWIFTNIAAGNSAQTKLLVTHDVIPLLADLLTSSNLALVEQATWALGNVIGDCAELRDEVLKLNVIEPILKCVDLQPLPTAFMRTLARTMLNFVRMEEPVPVSVARQLIPALYKLVSEHLDMPTQVDALWGLTYIADCGNSYIQEIVDSGITLHIITLLAIERPKVQLAAIRMLGNVATGTDEQTFDLIRHGLPFGMRSLLHSDMVSILRTSLWCLSNITVGPSDHVGIVVMSGLVPGIVANLSHRDAKVVREAAFTIRNIVVSCDIGYMIDIIDARPAPPLFELILHADSLISQTAEEALNVLFRKARQLVDHYRLLGQPFQFSMHNMHNMHS